MKSRIIYLIKHNHVIKWLYVHMGSLFLRMLGFFIKTDDNLVLFVPNTGKSFSGSPRDIYDYMQSQEAYANYRTIWAFDEPAKMAEEFQLETVKLDSLAYFITCLRAKYWVTDINIERGLRFKKKGTVFLNTWHGVAIKKIGNDDPNSAKYDYRDLDYLCVSGEYDKQVFSSALKAPETSFLEVGMPRNDRLFKATDAEKEELRKLLDIPEGKKVIVYVPTWRDSQDKGKTFGLAIEADFKKWQEELGEDYVILFRAHSRTTEVMSVEYNEFLRDYSSYPDLNDLLIVADVLITDYSSVVFDYAILEKPVVYFAYDYDAYLEERGCYFEPRDVFEQPILEEETAVISHLKSLDIVKESALTTQIKKSFMDHSHGQATQMCVEKLFSK
ncbi:CDP-glycerol glycerophosphotransferase family protein [Streptococcus saliviloxodontae]|uniref:CDP-glycerol glycerophosphotransferase n=1 Tax=Streptococcus saliviloxodontae TaxID=1349416 RepID=A0ABS2PJS3_9STRE|nr:CDP-glycerol glycerophosphotransferase family protein [Streptococcus saliviloxodontae]MBM7635594.1 CDP-glycerol glycerophosphotransferase [Streptococcus saliviloxodontae]